MLSLSCKTRARLKAHHKWAYWRLRAIRLLVVLLTVLLAVLHRQGSKENWYETHTPTLLHSHRNNQQYQSRHIEPTIGTNHSANRQTRNNDCDKRCVRITNPTPLFFFLFVFSFLRGGGKGKRQNFHSSLSCQHPI
jgi:hypothetical protein